MLLGRLLSRNTTYISSVVLLVAMQAGCGGGSDPSNHKVPVVPHVFILVEENHSYESVIGNPAMPYTNSLAQQYSLATQYYANRHNSLPVHRYG